MEDRRDRVAVVGGGPSGLAAAWRLAESGRSVRLYEATERVGGRLRTEVVAGRGADVGVQLVSRSYTATIGLLESMGLADRLVDSSGRDALWRDGRTHALRYGSVMSMVASGALPGRLKVRMGVQYVPFLERHRGSLDLNAPVLAGGRVSTTGPSASGVGSTSGRSSSNGWRTRSSRPTTG
jgi:protoporphyrinogen/coproporphyrinogen III oxidase